MTFTPSRHRVVHHGVLGANPDGRNLYASVPMELARDGELTSAARSVALYVWSHADTFEQSPAGIADALAMGANTVKRGLESLEARGWLVREKTGRSTEVWHLQRSNTPFSPNEQEQLSSKMDAVQNGRHVPSKTDPTVVQNGQQLSSKMGDHSSAPVGVHSSSASRSTAAATEEEQQSSYYVPTAEEQGEILAAYNSPDRGDEEAVEEQPLTIGAVGAAKRDEALAFIDEMQQAAADAAAEPTGSFSDPFAGTTARQTWVVNHPDKAAAIRAAGFGYKLPFMLDSDPFKEKN